MSAVFKREFRAYFASPLGYVVLTVLTLFSGLFFGDMFTYGYGNVSYVFSNMMVILMFVVPLLTMRQLSDERRQKTDQALLTAPVGITGIVLGKFFAAFALYAAGFIPILIFQIIVATKMTLNWLLFLSTLLGILLYGAALIAVGLFVSSLTESQVVAAVLSIVVSILINLMDSFASMANNEVVSAVVELISFRGRYESFQSGILDFSNVIFFLSVAAVFLFLVVRSLEKKRWA